MLHPTYLLFKDSIRSMSIDISDKYVPKYLSEFAYRSNRRAMQNAILDYLIAAVQERA